MNALAGQARWPALPAHARSGGATRDTDGTTPDAAARRVLTAALRWMEVHLEWFTPERWEKFLPPRPFRPGPLLELLGLIRLLDRSGIVPKSAPLPSRALDLAEHVVSETEFARGLLRGDEFFPYHLNLIALLDTLGRPQPASRATCAALLTADAGGHTRPYKPVLPRIELRYFVDRGGFSAPAALPDLATLYRLSVAALRPDVLQLTDSETYALTHVLFYVTDFGQHRYALGGTEEVARLRETVRVLLGVQLAHGNLDLLAELLLCDAVLGDGSGCGPLMCESWESLARAQRPDGAMPGSVHRPEVLSGLTGDRATAYLFGTCYHTTLAVSLAVAARGWGAWGWGAPSGVPLPAADPGEVREWAREVSRSAETVSAAVRDVWCVQVVPLLVLCVRARDPAVLADVLRAAGRLGVGECVLVRSAAALLTAWLPGG